MKTETCLCLLLRSSSVSYPAPFVPLQLWLNFTLLERGQFFQLKDGEGDSETFYMGLIISPHPNLLIWHVEFYIIHVFTYCTVYHDGLSLPSHYTEESAAVHIWQELYENHSIMQWCMLWICNVFEKKKNAVVKDILTPCVFSTRGVYNELIERRGRFFGIFMTTL